METFVSNTSNDLETPAWCVKLDWTLLYLVDGRFLYYPRCVRGQQAVCGHDVYFVGAPLFQDLRCRDKVANVVYDVILRERESG